MGMGPFVNQARKWARPWGLFGAGDGVAESLSSSSDASGNERRTVDLEKDMRDTATSGGPYYHRMSAAGREQGDRACRCRRRILVHCGLLFGFF